MRIRQVISPPYQPGSIRLSLQESVRVLRIISHGRALMQSMAR